MPHTLVFLESAGSSEGAPPWVIGAIALGILLLLLLAVVTFGGGREHS